MKMGRKSSPKGKRQPELLFWSESISFFPNSTSLNVEGLTQCVPALKRFHEVLECTIALLPFQYQCLQHVLLVNDLFVQQCMHELISAGTPFLDPGQGVGHPLGRESLVRTWTDFLGWNYFLTCLVSHAYMIKKGRQTIRHHSTQNENCLQVKTNSLGFIQVCHVFFVAQVLFGVCSYLRNLSHNYLISYLRYYLQNPTGIYRWDFVCSLNYPVCICSWQRIKDYIFKSRSLFCGDSPTAFASSSLFCIEAIFCSISFFLPKASMPKLSLSFRNSRIC